MGVWVVTAGLLACVASAHAGGTMAGEGIVTVDLSSLRNHDLFDGAQAPLIRLATRSPVAAPVPLPLDFDPGADPDAVLLRATAAPNAPVAVTVPVGASGRALYLLTAAMGPLEVRDIIADGSVVYANGATQPLKWMVGEQAWPAWAGATGRDADPFVIGVNPAGDTVTASLLTVDLAYPDVAIAELRLTSRPGPLAFALLAITVTEAPPITTRAVADREASPGGEGWFAFTPRAYPRVESARRESGPASRAILVRDGHLAYADGGRARLWGVNLVGPAALVPPEQAPALAKHLADAGFDLARLHHLDQDSGASLVNPKRGQPGESAANPEVLDRLDRVFAELKAAGVYTWLETWTLRSFKPGEGVPAPEGVPLGSKYASTYWKEWEDAQKVWARTVWDRVNPYTGIRYAEDPAVAVVELGNEDSLLVAWSGGGLERIPAPHRARLDERWNAWLREKYGTDARLSAAWQGRSRSGLQLGEALALDSVAREPSQRARTDMWPTQRAADLVSFYAELEAAHHAEMARFYREDLGFRAPIVCDTSFGQPVADALLAQCDVIDLHVYWDPAPERSVFHGRSLVEEPERQRIVEELAWCQDGKPCTVSELGHTYPNRYAHEAPLVWAALGGRQDWDAIAWFAWAHGAFDPAAPPAGTLDLQGRSSALVHLPAASALFRDGGVSAADRRFVRWWSSDGLLRDLAEGPTLLPDLHASVWGALTTVLRTSFAKVPSAPSMATGTASSGPIRWADRRFAVSTPNVVAVIGRGAVVSARLQVSSEQFVAASLVSLDGENLANTTRALLALSGRGERAGTLWSEGGQLLAWGEGPMLLERVRGVARFRWEQGRPRAWALDEDAQRTREIQMRRVVPPSSRYVPGEAWWEIETEGLGTPWVEVVPR
jgi:hypothetical protein